MNERRFTETTRELDYGVLQFVDVTGDEAGEYICTASNSVGTSTVTVELSIRGINQMIQLLYILVGLFQSINQSKNNHLQKWPVVYNTPKN